MEDVGTLARCVAGRLVCGVAEVGALRGGVNGRLTEALERARWSLHDCGAAGRSAAWGGACATYAAPPARRGGIRGVRGTVVLVGGATECLSSGT